MVQMRGLSDRRTSTPVIFFYGTI
ncbi:hypothetical protein BDFB_011841 [Asbolus verrucosus]|uniref:Uncharacterized protein n=1 Tax=Asbolus verrucosus TaxID=1661398 RepID=A0A482VF85_ASBVE|nr:hypothetical protein BDFB_011841 [Asbolus verrucosus]